MVDTSRLVWLSSTLVYSRLYVTDREMLGRDDLQ
jgi:hypothetical protein